VQTSRSVALKHRFLRSPIHFAVDPVCSATQNDDCYMHFESDGMPCNDNVDWTGGADLTHGGLYTTVRPPPNAHAPTQPS